MRRENVSDLLAFLAVARERSFTKAGKKLGISQSALSHTIRGLEERLGLRLLTRTTRSVSPTEAGDRLLASVGSRFEEIEAELEALSELRDKPAGTIRITTAENAASTIVLPKLAGFLLRISGHQGRDRHRLWADRHRRPALRRRRAIRRASGERHDRSPHRPGHAYGGRQRAVLFRQATYPKKAAGPDRAQLHQFAPPGTWRLVCVGVRKRQAAR